MAKSRNGMDPASNEWEHPAQLKPMEEQTLEISTRMKSKQKILKSDNVFNALNADRISTSIFKYKECGNN